MIVLIIMVIMITLYYGDYGEHENKKKKIVDEQATNNWKTTKFYKQTMVTGIGGVANWVIS